MIDRPKERSIFVDKEYWCPICQIVHIPDPLPQGTPIIVDDKIVFPCLKCAVSDCYKKDTIRSLNDFKTE